VNSKNSGDEIWYGRNPTGRDWSAELGDVIYRQGRALGILREPWWWQFRAKNWEKWILYARSPSIWGRQFLWNGFRQLWSGNPRYL